MSDTTFNTLLTEVDNFSYEQCATLYARLSEIFTEKKLIQQAPSPIDLFLGVIDENDRNKMLTAVQECRKTEPNEWQYP